MAVCQRQFACPDPNNPPDPSFTMADCVTLNTHACTDKLPAGETSAVSCYGATHVNTAAQTMCLSAIAMATCADVNALPPPYDDICSMVCTTGSTTGGAGSTGAGGSGAGGSGAGGSTGGGFPTTPPTSPTDFCNQFTTVSCEQVYACVPAASRGAMFQMNFGTTVQECDTMLKNQSCPTIVMNCTTFTATDANACLMKWAAETCANIADQITPAECNTACL
jgi:hypothetical protein